MPRLPPLLTMKAEAMSTINIWSLFASAGGKAGIGKAKRRSPEHYARISALAAKARTKAAKARRRAAKAS
jgi:hypothetical protein